MTIKSGIQGLIDRLKSQFPTTSDASDRGSAATAVAIRSSATTAVETKPPMVSTNGDSSAKQHREVLNVVKDLDSRVSKAIDRLVREVSEHVGVDADSLVKQIDTRMTRLGQQVAPIGDVAVTAQKIVDQCTQLIGLVSEQQRPAEMPDVKSMVDGAAERVLGTVRKIDERLDSHVTETKTRSDGLKTAIDGAVKRLSEGAVQDHLSMDGVRREVETATVTMREAAKRSETLTQNVRAVGEATVKLQQSIGQLKQSVEQRDAHLTALIEKNRKSLTMFTYGFCIAGLLAMGLAVVSFFV